MKNIGFFVGRGKLQLGKHETTVYIGKCQSTQPLPYVDFILLNRLVYTRKTDCLAQGWGTRGPRATCNPRNVFKRSASLLYNCNVRTVRERMRTKHGLHPCDVTVAGDVALVLVSVRFHTDIIKLHHVLFNKCYH